MVALRLCKYTPLKKHMTDWRLGATSTAFVARVTWPSMLRDMNNNAAATHTHTQSISHDTLHDSVPRHIQSAKPPSFTRSRAISVDISDRLSWVAGLGNRNCRGVMPRILYTTTCHAPYTI